MSTKIYNGFKINTSDISLINKIFSEFKDEYTKEILNIEQLKIHEDMTRIFDNFYYKNKIIKESNESESIFSYIMNEFNILNNKLKNGIRVPHLDFGFNIFLFPINNYVIGYYYTEQKYGRDLFDKIINNNSLFEEYSYYNNTDKPDNIPEREWEKRGENWDIVLSEKSLVFEILIHKTDLFPVIDLNYIPDIDKRAKKFILYEYINNILNKKNPTVSDYNEGLDYLYDVESNEPTSLYLDILSNLKLKLKKEITLEDFFNNHVEKNRSQA